MPGGLTKIQRHKPEPEVVEIICEDTGEETFVKQRGLKLCAMCPACLGPRTWKKIHSTKL